MTIDTEQALLVGTVRTRVVSREEDVPVHRREEHQLAESPSILWEEVRVNEDPHPLST